jgi:hypothetical protein
MGRYLYRLLSFIGDSNTFNMSTDETNATGADGSNVNVQVTATRIP